MTRTLLASAAAALISLGTLGASTSTASASWYGYGGGVSNNGFYFNFGYRQPAPYPRPVPVVRPAYQQVCSPSYRTITAWDPYYGWVNRQVYNGQVCNYVPVARYRGW